jgi:pimeloyl-ACP methyl ester carboxylesterase
MPADTQYVWESQVVYFAAEVMQGRPLVLAGNSIGGGLAAGAAATLGPLTRGLVLCNTAGVLEEPDTYEPSEVGVGAATLRGVLPTRYSAVPLVGQRGLDLFGEVVIAAIFPSIAQRLADIYADSPGNADAALAFAIAQGASSPGSANVIGSGQKLAPNRPLNEVLGARTGFGGPVLVAQGKFDRVSGPAKAQERAATFRRLRDGVSVELLDAGHWCAPHHQPWPLGCSELPDTLSPVLHRSQSAG